jgi:hypothetical protein
MFVMNWCRVVELFMVMRCSMRLIMTSTMVIVSSVVLWVVFSCLVVIMWVNWLMRGRMNWRVVLVFMLHVVLKIISENRCSIS